MIIFDLDTLADCEHRRHFVDGNLELRIIKDFPKYLAGSDGHIYSINYLFKSQASIPRRLKTCLNRKNGYKTVCLKKDKRQFSKKVHLLICESYNGDRPFGHDCSHLDDDKENNIPQNLIWEKHSNNIERSFENGKSAHGCNSFNSKFSPEDFNEIKDLLENRVRHIDIAKKFNCCRTVITKINTGDTYKRWK